MPASIWLDALVLSAIYVLMASGLVLVFSIMGIFNFAHGQFYMMGAYAMYCVFEKAGCNFFVGLVAAAVAVGIIGVLVERFVYRTTAQPMQVVVASIAMIGVFEGFITLVFGPSPQSVASAFPGTLSLGGVQLSMERAFTVIVAVGLMAGLYFFLNRTRLGLFIRASAQEPTAAELFGIHVTRLGTLVMGIGCGLAALAGSIMAPIFYVDPWIGNTPLIMALLAIVIGGMGSLGGAVLGGILLGAIGSIGAYFVGFWSQLMAFTVVIAVLLVRPQGVFGFSEK
jgi:branched-chain amino acid transport system permease protein